ncbi:hypothetical protein ATERTT37_003132 [Aspergillus terreus]
MARLYEVIVTEKLVWLVLEYCPGDELYNYLLRHGPLPVEKVKRIFTQLVGAVAYVHSKSCVHRDLKLENILLDKHENVKLCDFGFTREYEGKSSYLQTFCGTICYSAPEMLKGEKYAGEKVDVWSLGIILYALLAGELPFDEDDDQVTKTRILTEEPTFNEKFTEDAKSLINLLLSKRPLIRPSLDEILGHPFLAEHASEQLAILKIPRPAPFSTPLEKTTLQRMKSAGVNIDEVVDSVLAQRCDPLAGWWALLIEKEQRKERKRERKRREREAEAKNIRRLSAASTRLEKISAALVEVDEEGHASSDAPLYERGRRDRRSLPSQLAVPELPILPEPIPTKPVEPTAPNNTSTPPPPPIDKDSIRSASSTRRRPQPPPKDRRRSRPSTLHMSASQPELNQHSNGLFRRRTRRQYPIISQLASLKHWFVESAKRAKSPHSKAAGGPGAHRKFLAEKLSPAKGNEDAKKTATAPSGTTRSGELSTPTQIKRASNASSLALSNASYPNHRHSFPRQSRPRSAFKGPMVHTANLMVSGGMAAPECQNGGIGAAEPAGPARPAARKSQIIEEEDLEDEDIEEVDTFTGTEEDPGSPVDAGRSEDQFAAGKPADSPGRSRKPALAPAPDIDPVPIRPPRSSSLRSPRPGSSAAGSGHNEVTADMSPRSAA